MSDLSTQAKQALRTASDSFEPSPAQLLRVESALLEKIAPEEPYDAGANASVEALAVAPKLVSKASVFACAMAMLGAVALWLSVRVPEAAPSESVAPLASVAPSEFAPSAAPRALPEPETLEQSPEWPAPAQLERLAPQPGTQRAQKARTRPAEEASQVSVEVSEPSPPALDPLAPAPSQSTATEHASNPLAPSAIRANEPQRIEPRKTTPSQPLPIDTLKDEIALIRGARERMEHGDVASALKLLRRHAAEFPTGLLREERLATEVLALCRAQRFSEAEKILTTWKLSAPSAPRWRELEAACTRLRGGAL